jgi:uncharacterized protein (TIGR02466 family)
LTIRLGSPDFLRMSPTVVWTLQLDEEATQAINPGILRQLAKIRASAGEPSAGEKWQSGHALHRRADFHALVDAIHATTRKVLSFLEIVSEDFEITGCWANVNGIGASHGMHTHPNNFLSGVYYLQTQAGADTINFHDPRVQTAIIRPPVKAAHRGHTDQVVVRVQEGTHHPLAVSGLAPPLYRSQ